MPDALKHLKNVCGLAGGAWLPMVEHFSLAVRLGAQTHSLVASPRFFNCKQRTPVKRILSKKAPIVCKTAPNVEKQLPKTSVSKEAHLQAGSLQL